jgi:hypothetical protein
MVFLDTRGNPRLTNLPELLSLGSLVHGGTLGRVFDLESHRVPGFGSAFVHRTTLWERRCSSGSALGSGAFA